MKQPGQIVLFHFTQTDLSEGKLRPALLVGPLPGPYDDWLICMSSPQTHQYLEGFSEIVAKENSEFEASGLKRTSLIPTGRLAVVEADMLAGRIGHISPDRLNRLRKKLAGWLTSSNEENAKNA